jgi:surface protein
MAVINGRGTWGVRALIPNIITTTSNWSRPTDWLALNAPTDNTEQFTGLLAITNDDSNYVTLNSVATGGYTVDWGDGTVTTHAAGAVAEKKYEYSAISESTLCSRGYKQVVVKLTGTNVTQLQTMKPHSAIASATNVLATWLEYHINLPNCTFLRFNRGAWTNGAYQSWVEKVTINKLGNQPQVCSSLFNSFYALQEVVINATTTGFTDTNYMFDSCYYLKSVPLFDTSNVTTMVNMFANCLSLETIPSFNFGSVITASMAFIGCNSLNNVPALNLGNATNLYGFFQGCTNLTTIAGLTTTKCQEFSFMFTSCNTLETVPLFDTSKATAMGNMFSSCRSLTEIPAFDTSLVTQFGNTFLACNSLKSIPLLNTVKGITFTQMFSQCQSLDELPALNLTAGTTFTNMFSGVNGIAKAPFVNIKLSFSFVNQMLSRAAIVDIFNGLASGVTAKTITVSGNPGYLSLTTAERAIATGKGWTIA